jgi:hypothetical protein
MSGENAIFDLPLAAAMAGTKVSTGSVDIQFHDIVKVAAGATEITLSKTPKVGGEPVMIYTVNKDGTLAEKLEVGADGDASYANGKITLGTALSADEEVSIFVPYTYEEGNATKFENFADAATIPSRIVVEGLGRDVCDHHQVYFYITAPYAELSYDGEFGFATDSTYSFTLNCKKPYCDDENGLYAVIVVDAE